MILDVDKDWYKQEPFNIYGPCSAESRKQVMNTAEGIHDRFGEVIFRAGIWKPRTRPNSFEGVGEQGLVWLKEVRERFGFQVISEVANAQHVELCLKHGLDMLWIGARTTVNPFSVQEIADALVGVDIPVFVKNPIHSDLSLWIGALERINKAGVKKLAAIHRGFYEWDCAPYRNSPRWELPIELKRQFENLPIVCDISHISGNRELLPIVAQKAVDLDFDGLMIECHENPNVALSDAAQQVTPQRLKELIDDLIQRSTEFKDDDVLLTLRKKIDALDDLALQTLAKRMELINEVGVYKKEHKITILQVARLRDIINRNIANGVELGLSEDFIQDLLNAIHSESIKLQADIMNKGFIVENLKE